LFITSLPPTGLAPVEVNVEQGHLPPLNFLHHRRKAGGIVSKKFPHSVFAFMPWPELIHGRRCRTSVPRRTALRCSEQANPAWSRCPWSTSGGHRGSRKCRKGVSPLHAPRPDLRIEPLVYDEGDTPRASLALYYRGDFLARQRHINRHSIPFG